MPDETAWVYAGRTLGPRQLPIRGAWGLWRRGIPLWAIVQLWWQGGRLEVVDA